MAFHVLLGVNRWSSAHGIRHQAPDFKVLAPGLRGTVHKHNDINTHAADISAAKSDSPVAGNKIMNLKMITPADKMWNDLGGRQPLRSRNVRYDIPKMQAQ
jgi:orotidine-5'-phosphate decarboxylase